MPNRFCAICGKFLNNNSPQFNMCMKCYLNENPLFELPESFSLKICKECGMYSKKEVWLESHAADIYSIIEDAVRRFLLKKYIKSNYIEFSFDFDELSFSFNSKGLLNSLTLWIKGVLIDNPQISTNQKIDIRIINELCNNCTNLKSGMFFLSIIQLRVKNENFFDIIADSLSRIQLFVEDLFIDDNRQYISKLENQKYGVDLFLSTNELMKKIIVFLKPNYHFILKRSKKLVGRDIQRGQNTYRLKSLIKFLPFKRADYIMLDNEKYHIENITQKRVFLRNENNIRVTKDYNYFFDEKVSVIVLRDEP